MVGCSRDPGRADAPPAVLATFTSDPPLLLAAPSDQPAGSLVGRLRARIPLAVGAGARLLVRQGFRDEGRELAGAELRYPLAPLHEVDGRALNVTALLVDPATRATLASPPVAPLPAEQGWFEVRAEGPWPAGTELLIQLGDPIRPGHRLATNPLPLEVDLLASLIDAAGTATPLEGTVPVRIAALQADWLRVLAPAEARAGEPVPVTVAFMAGFSGPERSSHEVPLPAGSLTLVTADGSRQVSLVIAAAADESRPQAATVAFPPLSPGVWRLHARFGATPSPAGISNPIVVGDGPRQLFFGSIHNHTLLGGHATSSPPRALAYARDVAALDFVALSEHREAPTFDGAWLVELAERFHADGRFGVFTAWEWTDPDAGHRHVLQRVPVVPVPSPPDWKSFAATVGHAADALVVVHHPIWNGGRAQRKYDWGEPGAAPRQLLAEAYSWHGVSLAHESAFPLHGNREQELPAELETDILSALGRGQRTFLVADSDNHLGKPGSLIGIEWNRGRRYAYHGLIAARAAELTRDALFGALERGACYGTTGARIQLDARRDGERAAVAIHACAPLHSVTLRTPVAIVDAQSFDALLPERGDGTAPLYLDPTRGVWDTTVTLDAGPGGAAEPWIVEVATQDLHRAWLLLPPPSWSAR